MLDELGIKYGTDKASPWHGYLRFYETLLSEFREKTFNLLEIGVWHGDSIRMWLEYFPKAHIFGIDTNATCASFPGVDPSRYHFRQINQDDPNGLRSLASEVGRFSVIIDDGSHRAESQLASLLALWPFVSFGGYYLIEDLMVLWDKDWAVLHGSSGPAYLLDLIGHLNFNGTSYYKGPGYPANPPRPESESPIEDVETICFHYGVMALRKSAIKATCL